MVGFPLPIPLPEGEGVNVFDESVYRFINMVELTWGAARRSYPLELVDG